MKKNHFPKRSRHWTLLVVALVFTLTAKATIWPIPNTEADTLENFIENTANWDPGDTIMLSDASEYLVNGTIDLFQEVTIMGDPNLSEKPSLKFNDNGLRAKEDSISITIKGLKFDGYRDDSSRCNHMLRFDQPDFYNYKNIVVEDCEIWGFKGGVQLYKNSWTLYDTIILDNNIWFDMAGDYVIDPRLNATKYMAITNSTFYDIENGFLKNPYYSDPGGTRPDVIDQEIVIDRNTFYNVTGAGNNSLIQINDPDDGSVSFSFTNNIVSRLFAEDVARPFRINELAGDFSFTHSTSHDFYSTYQDGVHNLDSLVKNQSNIDTLAIYRNSPEFADTANSDFSLSHSSPLLTAASDDGAIGDPRWVPVEQPWEPGDRAHLIPNSEPDTLENFIEQYYDTIWQDGDTILLVSSSEYLVNGTVDFFGEITVMGDPRLSAKPSLRFYDNGFRAKEDSINVTIKGLRLNGYRADSSRANHMLRFDQAPYYNYKNILVEDCEVWGFKGGVQLYKNSWTLYDTVILDNNIWFDMAGDYVIDPRLNATKYMAITNSTFYDIETGFLKNPYYSDPGSGRPDVINQEIVIDRNTFYNVTGAGNNALIQVNDPDDESVSLSFTNNIVSKIFAEDVARPFRINELAGDFSFTHSTFHDFYSTYQDGVHNLDSVATNQANVTTNNIYRFYPGFADTTDGYFMLPDTSSLLSASSEGGPIGDPRWVPTGGVTIREITEEVVEGYDIQLLADVVLSEGADNTLTWTVENNYDGTSGEATIDASNGLLSPVAAGKILVTATSNHNEAFSDQVEITIAEEIPVTAITLEGTDSEGSPTDEITNQSGFLTITATIEPLDAHNQSVSWSLSGDGKASISETSPNSAKLVAIQCGTVTVTATADGSGIEGTLVVTISGQTPVESIAVAGEGGATEITTAGGTMQMNATISPDTACIKEVTWSVDDESIATISDAGMLTAVANGVVTVEAQSTDGKYRSGTAEITISGQTTGINPFLADHMMIMPNPASDFIQVNTTQQVDMTITNMVGTTVLKQHLKANEILDISGLTPGVYIVTLETITNSKSMRLLVE